jgi:hypothetical protein
VALIRIPDEQAAALQAKAQAQGLTLAEWLQELAEAPVIPAEVRRAQAAAERIRAIRKRSKPDPEGWTILDYINQGRP